jgi:putative hydrolase of the HAD superfamily
MIRAVCFDLDGTLVEDGNLGEAVLRASQAVAAMRDGIEASQLTSINREVFTAAWQETESDFIHGKRSGDEISRDVWRRALSELGFDDAALAETAFRLFARETIASYRLYDDALAVLESLGRRMPLAVITNGTSDVQRRKLVTTGIEWRFRAVMVSGELGTPNPDARIFLGAAELMGVEPSDVLHVGDSLEADVAGALGAGMTGVWINRHGRSRDASQAEPHHEISSLGELPGLLR